MPARGGSEVAWGQRVDFLEEVVLEGQMEFESTHKDRQLQDQGSAWHPSPGKVSWEVVEAECCLAWKVRAGPAGVF